MSTKVSTLVWERAIAPDGAKMLLLRLADHSNDQGRNIFPGMKSLAKHLGSDVRTVQRRLRLFEELGVLKDAGEVVYGRGRMRGWQIDLAALAQRFPHVDKAEKPLKLSAALATLKAQGEEAGEADNSAADDAGGGGDPSAGEGEGKGGSAPPFSTGDPQQKGGSQPSINPSEKGGAQDGKGGREDTKGWHQAPPKPLRTVKEPSAASRGGPGGPREAAGENETAPPAAAGDREPINALWKEARPIFVKRHGEPMALIWWDACIPLRYDGDLLVLGLPDKFHLDRVTRLWSGRMGDAYRDAGGSGGISFEISEIAGHALRARRKARQENVQAKPRPQRGRARAHG